MSKVRDLPELSSLAQDDLIYSVDYSVGTNGGRKTTIASLKTAVEMDADVIKTKYESNPDTNAFTDAEKTKLAGIENGATADQNADEVPFDNSGSNIIATNVEAAIKEIAIQTNELKISETTGLIVGYSSGKAWLDGTFYSILAGNLLLATNITNGTIYLDNDGIIKQTGSSTSAPPNTIPLAQFSTDLTSVLSLVDERQHLGKSIVRGLSGEITDIGADNIANAGATNKFADAGHIHTISTAAAVTLYANSTNTSGTSNSVSRADHTHDISTSAPITSLSPSSSNSEGVGADLSRNDHSHSISTALVADITTIQPDDAASAGTSDSFARGDHRHAIATAAPSNTGIANSEGVSTSFARADHVHNTIITNSSATATASDTTTSLTDVLMASMTLTPSAGTYLVQFNSSTVNSANGVERNYISIYSGGVQVAASERRIGTAGGAIIPIATSAIVSVDGSQAIEIRWRVIAGTGTVYQRTMTIVRLG